MKEEDTAESELLNYLEEDETIEAVVFGGFGWASDINARGYNEPDPPPVPFNRRGKILTWEEARPLMRSWSFYGGYGAPKCYAVRIWTNQRVIWVTQYDGSTQLNSAPRNPIDCDPDMPGG